MIHKSTVLLLIAGVCLGGDVVLSPGPVTGTVGGSVWINTTISRTDKPLRRVEWKMEGTYHLLMWRGNNKRIIASFGNNTNPDPVYRNRVNMDTHTGSLQLLNLTMRDSGTYTVTIIKTATDSALMGTTTLHVFEACLGSEPVPESVGKDVWINTTLSPATEPLSLIKWTFKGRHIVTFNSGQIDPDPVYRDRVRLDRHTGSLELLNVTVSDSGEYTVTIQNTPEDTEIKCRTVLNVSGVCLGGDVVLSLRPMKVTVGGSVWINTNIRRTNEHLKSVEWTVRRRSSEHLIKPFKRIITSSGNTTSPEPDYRGRVSMDTHTGSLQLLNVTVRDIGIYTVTIVKTDNDPELKATTTLRVSDNFHRRDRRGAIASSVFFTVVIGGLGIYLWYRNGELDQIEPNEQEMTPYSHVNANDPDVSNDH